MRGAKLKNIFSATLLTATFCSCTMKPNQKELFYHKDYQIYPDKVVQGDFTAEAKSATHLISNYKSPDNEFISPLLSFKFSVNGKDDEMPAGKNHQLKVLPKQGDFVSPVIKFGEQYLDQTRMPANLFLRPDTHLTLRVDMNEMLHAFKTKGYFTFFDGTKLYKNDFKGVFVAGDILPLNWDFDNIANNPKLELKDRDGDGIYTQDFMLNQKKEQKSIASSWKLSKDISAFPQYHSPYILADAIYNMSLEEMEKAIQPDSTFRTGKEWAGVWTRDISYSIILSMAILQPTVAQISLMKKVKNERVIQDTGTGGSYPISTDRMIWAVAAWEVYKTTGDRDWLAKAYRIIKNSVEDDIKVAYDPETGLVKGESSFLDWREQTYPKWMQPADIYESECLGTNAVHFQVNHVLAQMAKLMKDGKAAEKYEKLATQIKNAINKHLWMPDKGYYAQYLYGRNFKIRSPRSEALGEALTVLFDIADQDRKRKVLENTPVISFGIPCIYPQIPEIAPYHNNAVWPFVQSYWAWAAAEADNPKSIMQSFAAIYRPSAMFLTNKENFVADDGDYAGTQINSSNMLWSLSGNISLIYKVLFGMKFLSDGLRFNPLVPEKLGGQRTLKNFKYQHAVLDIEMQGYGRWKSMSLDGKNLEKAEIPASLNGKHLVNILLDNIERKTKTNLVENLFSLSIPEVIYTGSFLQWPEIKNAKNYKIIKNGELFSQITSHKFEVKQPGEYQVVAIDEHQLQSFASEPIPIHPSATTQIIELEQFANKATYDDQGFSGKGFIEISKKKNTSVKLNFNIEATGLYALSFKYANGEGPTNTENKCAMRALYIDDDFCGTVVFPQRGKDEWSNWGFSNRIKIKLNKGRHQLKINFEHFNENMNGEINRAMLDYLQIQKLE